MTTSVSCAGTVAAGIHITEYVDFMEELEQTIRVRVFQPCRNVHP
jgi:hypothetical protein